MLHRDKRNSHSRHAVAVLRYSGEQCGYLPDETAEEVASGMKQGNRYVCYATQLTGGDVSHDKPSFGLNIFIVVIEDPETPDNAVQDYLYQNEIGSVP